MFRFFLKSKFGINRLYFPLPLPYTSYQYFVDISTALKKTAFEIYDMRVVKLRDKILKSNAIVRCIQTITTGILLENDYILSLYI